MPFLGGIIGGASGGGLGGMFGQSHKRANATGLSIDLSTGDVSNFQSSGSKENDRTARELRDSISDFTKDIQDTTKGTVSGYINPQVTDQGIKLDYSIPGYGSGTYKAEDSQDAIDKAELAIARGLTGISTTMKTVIDQVTDPKKLDAALKFADTYDKIETAAKDAFSSIPSDLDIAGPFKKAKDDIKDQFDDIAADAKKFGLSLKPVTDALDEANKRLTKDFDRYIKDLTTAVEDPLQSLVDIEKRAGDARLKDAKEVNGNILAVNKYNALALDKIWDDSTKSIKDFQKDLKSGESSGLTATSA
jgi:cytochrome c556